MSDQEIYNLVERRRKSLGLTQADVSRLAFGRSDTGPIQSLRRGNSPTSKTLRALCRALELEFYIGPPRGNAEVIAVGQDAPPVHIEIVRALDLPETASPQDVLKAIEERSEPGGPSEGKLRKEIAAAVRAENKTLHTELAAVREDLADATALVAARAGEDPPGARPVDVIELNSAAGGGADVLSEEVSGSVWFRRDWLDSLGLNANDCIVIGVVGESMEPILIDGSKILVNQANTRRKAGDIFVVRTEHGLVVKRARKDADGNWLLASDHPAWKDMAWPDDAVVIGRVMWTALTLRGR